MFYIFKNIFKCQQWIYWDLLTYFWSRLCSPVGCVPAWTFNHGCTVQIRPVHPVLVERVVIVVKRVVKFSPTIFIAVRWTSTTNIHFNFSSVTARRFVLVALVRSAHAQTSALSLWRHRRARSDLRQSLTPARQRGWKFALQPVFWDWKLGFAPLSVVLVVRALLAVMQPLSFSLPLSVFPFISFSSFDDFYSIFFLFSWA